MAAARRLRTSAERPRQELYLIHGQHSGDFSALGRARQAHLDYLHQLDMNGELVAAGPLLEREGTSYQGAGCFLIHAADYAAALEVAHNDPYHREGVRENLVSSWLVSEGSLYQLVATQREQL